MTAPRSDRNVRQSSSSNLGCQILNDCDKVHFMVKITVPEEFIGKAKCGCVYHAEEGTACPHDITLYRAAKRAELIEKLRPPVDLPKFTHDELMILADALSQYHDNQAAEDVERDGMNPNIERALEKLMAYQAGLPQPVDIEKVLSSPMLVAGPHTKEKLHSAPPFAIFVGHPDLSFDVGSLVWDMFDIAGSAHGDLEEAARKTGLHVLTYEPEADRDASEANEGRDDFDAALAFLKAGGVLCKVPDAPGSPYYHLMSVNVFGAPTSGNCRDS